MPEAMLKTYTTLTAWRMWMTNKAREEHGEGIISLAIAVLIVAALGLLAWQAFDLMFTSTKDKAQGQIDQIG